MSEEEKPEIQKLNLDIVYQKFDVNTIVSSILAKDFNKLCRTCLCEKKLTFTFLGNEDKIITNILKNVMQLEDLKDQNLPQNICISCREEIERFYIFRQKSKQNEIALKRALQTRLEESHFVNCSNTASTDLELKNLGEETNENANVDNLKLPQNSSKPGICKLEQNVKLPKYTCRMQTCSETFNTNDELILHRKEKHRSKAVVPKLKQNVKLLKYTCRMQTCLETFNTNDELILHRKEKHRRKAVTCKLKQNVKLPKYTCRMQTCLETFNTNEELILHRKEKHSTSQCKVCNKTFNGKRRNYYLKLHLRIHNNEKPYACDSCPKKFAWHGNLQRHKMGHDGVKPYVCEICGKAFIQAVTLKGHMKTHTNIQIPKSVGHRIYRKKAETDTLIICKVCGLTFKEVFLYNIHLSKHNLDTRENEGIKELEESELIPQEVRKYICGICNRPLKTKETLRVHRLTHGEKAFLCGVCGKRFFSKAAVDIHTKVHTGEKPYSCPICMKSFSQRGAQQSHMLIHTGEKPFSCKFCCKLFTQRCHLAEHVKIHTGEKPFACSFCDRRFAAKSTMRVHTRIHTGETPFLCNICGKGFHDSSSRTKHQRRHQNSTTVTKEMISDSQEEADVSDT